MQIARTRGAGKHPVVKRIRLSMLAVLAGWLAASSATLPLEVLELVRNAVPGKAAHDLVEGCAVWYGFTLLVALAVWLILVLAIAVVLPPRLVIRFRLALACGSAVLGAAIVGTELDLWRGFTHPGPESPFASFVLQIYMTYAVVFAGVVTWAYSALLERQALLLPHVEDRHLAGQAMHGSRR